MGYSVIGMVVSAYKPTYSNFVRQSDFTGESIELIGISGKPMKLKLAEIPIFSPKFKCEQAVTVEVAVSFDPLPWNVAILLGNDVFDSTGLIDPVQVSENDTPSVRSDTDCHE